MRWLLFLPLLVVTTGGGLAYGAGPSESPAVGRYQLGGTERDGLILIDTATGMSWKYSRDVRPGANEPVWIPLRFPDKAGPSAAMPAATPAMPQQETAVEKSWLAPGPYKDKRPGGK